MNSLTDNALMLKVKAGSLDHMGLLFERHYQSLFSFIYRMTTDRENSEDMVQNVFLRMIKYRHTYKGEGEFKTWMYHLARNVMNDYFKAKTRKIEVPAEPYDTTSDEKEDQVRLLEIALNKLSEEQREILILSRYQELAYSEIARILEISEANVRVRIHRAIAQLKTIYLKLSE